MGGRKKNAMLLKETLKEMNRLKSNCSARRSIYALLMTLLLLFLFAMAMFVHRIHAPNPCSQSMHETTETTETNMRYPKSLTPSPTVARRCWKKKKKKKKKEKRIRNNNDDDDDDENMVGESLV